MVEGQVRSTASSGRCHNRRLRVRSIALRDRECGHYDSGMTRRRRIVRRVLVAAAVPVLLVLGYVGTWLAVSRAEHNGYITFQTVQTARPVFTPLISYGESDRPGAGLLRELWWMVNPPVWQVFSSGSGDAVVTGSFVLNSPIAPPHPDAVPASGRRD